MPNVLKIRRGRGVTRRLLDGAGAGVEAFNFVARLSSGALGSRFLLVKIGADKDHVALAAAVDTPLGVAQAITAGAEENIDVALCGTGACVKMQASGAIALGALLEPAANGQVQTLTGSVGTHHVVGRALIAAAQA